MESMKANKLRAKRNRNHKEQVLKYVNNILDKADADAQHWNVSQYEIPLEFKEDVITELEKREFQVTSLDQERVSVLTIKW